MLVSTSTEVISFFMPPVNFVGMLILAGQTESRFDKSTLWQGLRVTCTWPLSKPICEGRLFPRRRCRLKQAALRPPAQNLDCLEPLITFFLARVLSLCGFEGVFRPILRQVIRRHIAGANCSPSLGLSLSTRASGVTGQAF